MPHLSLTSLLALALALTGCKSEPEQPTPDAGKSDAAAKTDGAAETPTPTSTTATDAGPSADADDPRASALEIAKAQSAAAIGGKGAKHLGFNLAKISHLFALKATAKLPSWGAPGEGDPTLTRDDDLDTSWRCEFGQASPCVLGLALPEQAKVEALRLYVAAGPKFRDYKGNPRAHEIRVHTDAGFVDVKLDDGANHVYVHFDAPIATQSLAIEVLSVHAGDKTKLLHFADVEVYGTDGVARGPMQLDPSHAWVYWETTAWSGEGESHTIRQTFVYVLRPGEAGSEGPARRRLTRATAVYGEAGDDYALFERLNGSDCSTAEGGYVLFDKRNRMHYPLNDLGGAGGQVFRHAAGHGFAVGWMNDQGQFTIKGVVEEAGVLEWRRPPSEGTSDGKALLSRWGFDPQPLSRGVVHGGAVPGCHAGATGELDALVDKLPALHSSGALDPSQWMVCSVGGDTLYTTAQCDTKPRAYQLDASGKLVGKFEGKADDARGLRLRRAGDLLFVELSAEKGDTASLMLAAPGKLDELERHGGLFVRPPAACYTCEDEWRNPAGDPTAGEDAEAGEDWMGEEEMENVDAGLEDGVDEGGDEVIEPENVDAGEEPEADEGGERPEAPPNPTPP